MGEPSSADEPAVPKGEKKESTREKVLRLAHAHPEWTATRIGDEADCSEALVRRILRQAGEALPSQWRASRRRGIQVLKPPPAAALPASVVTETPPEAHEEVPETLPVEWDVLRLATSASSDPTILDNFRRRYSSKGPLPGWDTAVSILESVEESLLNHWEEYQGKNPTRIAPPVFRSIPSALLGPLVTANTLLAAIEERTAGAYDYRVVPESELELVDAILSLADRPNNVPLAQAWEALEAAKRGLQTQLEAGDGVDEMLLMMGPVIRCRALTAVASGTVKSAGERVLPLLDGLKLKFWLKDLLNQSSSSRKPGGSGDSATPPDSSVGDRRFQNLRVLRDACAREPPTEGAVESLLLRATELAESTPQFLEGYLQGLEVAKSPVHSWAMAAVSEVTGSFREDLSELVYRWRAKDPLFLSDFIDYSAEMIALRSPDWLLRSLSSSSAGGAGVGSRDQV
jgi:hypothetical protein